MLTSFFSLFSRENIELYYVFAIFFLQKGKNTGIRYCLKRSIIFNLK